MIVTSDFVYRIELNLKEMKDIKRVLEESVENILTESQRELKYDIIDDISDIIGGEEIY